jgi:competence protein ComGF
VYHVHCAIFTSAHHGIVVGVLLLVELDWFNLLASCSSFEKLKSVKKKKTNNDNKKIYITYLYGSTKAKAYVFVKAFVYISCVFIAIIKEFSYPVFAVTLLQ